MTKSPLVSILTPCYNTGSMIHRLLESVLMQDYPNLEMITIDDGSSDNTADVINSYIPKFESKGYTLKYIYQENQGQSAAINNGLKTVRGDFFTWPDSDDWYKSPSAISKAVNALLNSDETVGLVRCQQSHVSEDDFSKEVRVTGENYNGKRDSFLFEDCLFYANGFWFGAGCYLVKFTVLKETTDLEIYTEKNAGQNWQLMLPILFKYKCITIPETLYTILDRSSSHSRGQFKTYEERLALLSGYENTIIATLKRIKDIDPQRREQLIQQIKNKYQIERHQLALYDDNYSDEAHLWKEIREANARTTLRLQVLHLLSRLRIRKSIFKIKRMLKVQ